MIPTLSWWLVIQLFGLAALPLAWRLCARLPGRGYPLAKALGLLLISFILWLGASFGLLSNDVGGVLVALVLVVALSAWLGREGLRRDRPLLAWLRANWLLVLATELLFLIVLAGWTVFRAYSGDIAGTEKPMEFAFINGVLRSRFFPPQDPWLSGYAISYYYFGYVMVAILIRLTGVDPAVGFNLAVALWYALTMIGAFGVAYDLVGLGGTRGQERGDAGAQGRGIRYGLLGALFVGFLGNLVGAVEVAYHRSLVPLSWIAWLDVKDLAAGPPSGGWTGGFWWWWHASRVIHDKDLLGQSVEVIDEFPFFSFLLGDLHPHVLALPFVLLAIGLALNLICDLRFAICDCRQSAIGNRQYFTLHISSQWRFLGDATGLGTPGILLYAMVLGGLAFLNTWDFPIYLALTMLAFGIGLVLSNGLTWPVVGRTAGAGAVFGVLGVLLYLPFYLGFQSQAGGILPNLLHPTRLSQYLLMFGPFLLAAVFFLALMSVGRGGAEIVTPLPHLLRLRSGQDRVLTVLLLTLLLPLAFVALVLLAGAVLPQGSAFAQTLLDSPGVESAAGGRTLVGLAGLIVRLRVATPWTYLFLVGMIAWAIGLLWARLTDKVTRWQGDKVMEESHPVTVSPCHPVTDLFAVLLVALALLLTFFVEFAYLKDFFGTRMNTVFKFYYQAWVMLALAAAYGMSRLAGRGVPMALKLPAWLLTGLLVLGGLVYPALAIPSKADNFLSQPTLDGLMFLRRNNPGDMAAIEWMRANLAADAIVLEAPGGSYSPEGAERISMSTGNPTLLGWDFHEMQWRGREYGRLAAGRPEAIDRIYRTARPEELPGLLEQWGIDYVYIGALERQKYGISQAALARFDRALKLVFDRDGVRIYAR